MRYLITGGAGFIGSHLADRLIADGHEVVALDNLSTGSESNVAHLVDCGRFELVHGSVLDELAVDELTHSCDSVIHLAAAVGVKLIVDHPLRSIKTNVRGFENVIEAAHRYNRPVLVASTSEVYGKNSSGPLSETSDRVLGAPSVSRWAYSATKGLDEALAYAYHQERGLPVVVIRLFNTVGPRQSSAYGMVIPSLVQQALRGEPLTVYGDGRQTRCFCHVSDVVAAMAALLDCDAAVGDVFNIGAAEEISILDLAQRIRALTNSTSEIQLVPYDVAYQAGFEDMMRRVPNTSKIENLVGWRPKFSLDEILDSVVDDHRKSTALQDS